MRIAWLLRILTERCRGAPELAYDAILPVQSDCIRVGLDTMVVDKATVSETSRHGVKRFDHGQSRSFYSLRLMCLVRLAAFAPVVSLPTS
jgi:hypothetical protein